MSSYLGPFRNMHYLSHGTNMKTKYSEVLRRFPIKWFVRWRGALICGRGEWKYLLVLESCQRVLHTGGTFVENSVLPCFRVTWTCLRWVRNGERKKKLEQKVDMKQRSKKFITTVVTGCSGCRSLTPAMAACAMASLTWNVEKQRFSFPKSSSARLIIMAGAWIEGQFAIRKRTNMIQRRN